ncbi:MAG: monovalent cation/H+ antiporter complex subunit F [Aeromicrobium erythreum]
MTFVAAACAAMLTLTGLLCVVRIVRGPTMLDRTVATDVLVAASIGAVGTAAAVWRDDATVPILVALALVGFLGSVSIARFAARDIDRRDDA